MLLGFVFELFLDRVVGGASTRMSEQATDEDRLNGAYDSAWAIGKTSGRSAQVLVEQLERWNVPSDLASAETEVGGSLHEWFSEGIPPRTVRRLMKQLPVLDLE